MLVAMLQCARSHSRARAPVIDLDRGNMLQPDLAPAILDLRPQRPECSCEMAYEGLRVRNPFACNVFTIHVKTRNVHCMAWIRKDARYARARRMGPKRQSSNKLYYAYVLD